MDLDPDACYRAVATRDARFDGRLFGAVKTTGIYCRPICPARTPRRENITFYPSAAAAQAAGYRPCLRCRPETAPDLAMWRGTSSTVARAVALIDGGAMDGADVEALAARLGLGGRQLRRLFHRHLGASPIAVAQTRRVLLAKQLLHETRLPMAAVADAAGFGSVRRFNEAFQALFKRSPSALRRRSAVPAEAPAGDVVIRLSYTPPYDWPAMLAFLAARAITGIEHVSAAGYGRTFEIDGVPGTVAVRPGGGHTLLIRIQCRKLSVLPAVIARVRRLFDLAADPQAIARHLRRDPVLRALVVARPGLRVPGAWDGFEVAVRAVLGQQITVPAAISLAETLVRVHGRTLGVTGNGTGLTHLFPRAERVANGDLTALRMPRSRADALRAVATAVAQDPQFFGPRRGLDETIDALRGLRGVGEWTAHYIAMREFREPDSFPAADVGLLKALQIRTGRARTPRQLIARAERWRPWRAYAAQHLWTSLAPSP